MAELPLPLQLLAAWIGTWIARRQERTIRYLKQQIPSAQARRAKRIGFSKSYDRDIEADASPPHSKRNASP
jgi:hypothetical protein